MTGGQSIDLASEGSQLVAAELETMHRLKTGALIEASVMSACCLSPGLGRDQRNALQSFAETIGLAFQIRDDILDVIGNTEELGKQAGADQVREKATWPAVFGIEESNRRCDELLESSINELTLFGEAAEPLCWLATFIVGRAR
jgi:geranylgeranyl pyrophosphate synthase